jgi:rod shape-determining protein MreB and related proteins
MLGILRSLTPILYIRLSPNNLYVQNVISGKVISEIPEVAISDEKNKKILGLGANAHIRAATTAHVVNPFAHPSLISDFTIANILLKGFVQQAMPDSLFRFAQKVVIHPEGDPEGGFYSSRNSSVSRTCKHGWCIEDRRLAGTKPH